jgi:hypothetical protein
MASEHTTTPVPRKPLRLWPGVAAAIVILLLWLIVPIVAPQAAILGVIGAVACGAIVLVWWLFFSRAPWIERVSAILVMILAAAATPPFLHESIRTGHMGMTFPLYVIPALSLALVAWAVAGQRLSGAPRFAAIVPFVLVGCGAFTLLRTDGVTGEGTSQFRWRWTPTAEQLLLARSTAAPVETPRSEPARVAADPPPTKAPEQPLTVSAPGTHEPAKPAPAAANADATGAGSVIDWPGFRGPARDGVVRGLKIGTDWARTPPVELWRRPIGPGWSSFAVHGDLIYTQEQRGDDEIVSCYRLSTGAPVWSHRDNVRFWESNGGAGPRGTPAVHNGRVYSLGATGIVNALDAVTGTLVWWRNAAADTGAELPGWGFAGSPLVVGDLVIVAASGRLAAYDVASGEMRWTRRTVGGGYSSPHLMTIDGVAQIVLLSGGGATGVAPADGAELWRHSWEEGVGIVQPAFAAERDVLITAGDAMGGVGMRRIALAHGPLDPTRGGQAAWTVEERWTSRGLKPYFNDFVVHESHAYGFDGSILACIDLENGERRWKGGRYGHGQFVLLPDQDVLLVLSEEGELALVRATPDQFTEIGRFPAIEGKTWNHPVLAGEVLLVRNGEQMAAFRLPRGSR